MLGFRAWDVKNKIMIDYRSGLYLDPYGTLCKETEYGVSELLTENLFIPMQSTGLKDNKGIEIFEKDILFYDPEEPPYIVVDIQLFYKDYYWGCLADNPSKIFIAGNVYENGSLIEGMFDAGI